VQAIFLFFKILALQRKRPFDDKKKPYLENWTLSNTVIRAVPIVLPQQFFLAGNPAYPKQGMTFISCTYIMLLKQFFAHAILRIITIY
jgi:hypothetical protein